ncbi:hypothetical protein BT93_H3857 [Corymbia citriodora subsp. variegata]|nr:hypothetical protein BT93_H3857 [Corymbia citriodora subsp. variegata]
MGRLFIGTPGPWADDNRKASHHHMAKISGLPIMYDSFRLSQDWPSPLMVWGSDFLECRICRNKLGPFGQVCGPITSGNLKIEDRVLYIFSCIAPKFGSIPLRSCEAEESNSTSCDAALATMPTEPRKAVAEATTVTSKSKKLNRNENSEEVAKLSASRPISGQANDSIPEEPYSKDVTCVCFSRSSLSINVDNHVQEKVLDEERYKYDRALMSDRTCFKFKKQLDNYLEQCFGYSNGGKPLLAIEEIGYLGRCKLCGGPRQFEMHLMPPLIYFLDEAADDSQKDALENWNRMTTIMHTCSKNCYDSQNEKSRSQCKKSLKQAIPDYASLNALPSHGSFSREVNSGCLDLIN